MIFDIFYLNQFQTRVCVNMMIFFDNLQIGCFRTYRAKVAAAEFIPWPIEIRFCEPRPATNQTKSPPRLAGCSPPIFAYIPVFYAFFDGRFGRRRKENISVPLGIQQSFAFFSLQIIFTWPQYLGSYWYYILSKTYLKFQCSLRYWFRAKGKLSDDQALHR